MKKFISFLTVLLLLAACAEDKGNYNYRSFPEPDITGVDDSLSVLIHDTLRLSPTLGSNIGDETAYTYQWYAIDREGDQQTTTLATTKNLDYEVTLDAGLYTLFFKVTDPTSGLYWQKEYALLVSDPTSDGWMVLCSEGDNGRAQLDFVSAVTGRTYTDVLKGNGMEDLHGPRRIQYLATMTDTSSPFYLFTDEGATRLGKNNFSWTEEYRFLYESAQGDDLKPATGITHAGFGKVVVSDGKAHYCEVMSISGLYGSAVNKGFDVSPYVGANENASIYAAVYLLYDTTHKRFMAYCPLMAASDLGGYDAVQTMDGMATIAETLKPGQAVTGSAFETWPTGYDLLYMENTEYDPGNGKMGRTYALLTDGTNLYLYGIQLGDLLLFADCTFVLGKSYYGELTACTDISQASCYAFSSLKNYMYYAVGGTVYRVDLSETPLKATRQFSLSGETITRMKFNLYQQSTTDADYDLVVASQNNTTGEGTFRIYGGTATEGDFSKVTPTAYTGFGKIVDVTYRERTN